MTEVKFWFINTIEFGNFPRTKSSMFSSHIDRIGGEVHDHDKHDDPKKGTIVELFSLEDVSYVKNII